MFSVGDNRLCARSRLRTFIEWIYVMGIFLHHFLQQLIFISCGGNDEITVFIKKRKEVVSVNAAVHPVGYVITEAPTFQTSSSGDRCVCDLLPWQAAGELASSPDTRHTLTDQESIKRCIEECEARIEIGLHYRNPYPRATYLPPLGLATQKGRKLRAQQRLRKQAKPIYLESHDDT
ncbi:hypothetical protein F2P81_022163 [Scophthalmus maximus]|uniref:Uncharacterized protein n=1 Tax=Scophthalmus maximus TaxID=52904 RepID=A0A6A4S1N8_SCOMX|nr:hypothetical protein F2P81_022163 [Scophthalmus maximus]